MSIANMNQHSVFHTRINAILSELVEQAQNLRTSPELLSLALARDDQDRARYFREIRTVQFDATRQSGKTTWAIKNSDKDTLVLVKNASTRDAFKHRWFEVESHRGCLAPTVWSYRDLEIALTVGEYRNYNKIIVDEASYYFDAQPRNKFYKAVLPMCSVDTLFILLG